VAVDDFHMPPTFERSEHHKQIRRPFYRSPRVKCSEEALFNSTPTSPKTR
jgi:hypothetical protein